MRRYTLLRGLHGRFLYLVSVHVNLRGQREQEGERERGKDVIVEEARAACLKVFSTNTKTRSDDNSFDDVTRIIYAQLNTTRD